MEKKHQAATGCPARCNNFSFALLLVEIMQKALINLCLPAALDWKILLGFRVALHSMLSSPYVDILNTHRQTHSLTHTHLELKLDKLVCTSTSSSPAVSVHVHCWLNDYSTSCNDYMGSSCICVAVYTCKACVCLPIFSERSNSLVCSCILHDLVGKQNGATAAGWLTSRCRHLTTGTCYCGVRDKAKTHSGWVSSKMQPKKGSVILPAEELIWGLKHQPSSSGSTS